MTQYEIIKRRRGRMFEVVEFDNEHNHPARIYQSHATFGNINDALDYMMQKRLNVDPIDFAIDTKPGLESR